MTETTPARRPGNQAKVDDIVQSQWGGSTAALWRVTGVVERETYSYGRSRLQAYLKLVSLKTGRPGGRYAYDMVVLSTAEIARLDAKRTERKLILTPDEADALWHLLSNEPLVDGDRVSPDGDHAPLTSVFEKLTTAIAKSAAA